MSHKVYTDGSAYWKDRSAGFGVVFEIGEGEAHVLWGPLPPGTSVQRAEVMAAIVAVKTAPSDRFTLVSDSTYLVDTMNQWGRDWLTRALGEYGITAYDYDSFQDLVRMYRKCLRGSSFSLENSDGVLLKNQDLWEKLWELLADKNVTFVWTPGHKEDNEHAQGNNHADMLASRGRKECIELHDLIVKEKVSRRME